MPDEKMKIALAGIGEIARQQHIPALRNSSDWQLAAAISRNATVDGASNHKDIDAFLNDRGDIEAISLALPPGPRFDYAVKAIEAGLHVMIEKPPAVTLAQCHLLRDLADRTDATFFVSWHSRMGRAIDEARRRLKGARLDRLRIDWREDVNQFHPGQDWIFEAGNLGVFDPGINAMSILTAILDRPAFVSSSDLYFPKGREAPIAADLRFDNGTGAEMTAKFDWRHDGEARWDIEFETDRGNFRLVCSGSYIEADGQRIGDGMTDEYPLLYALFADLVRQGRSETDFSPMIQVADAFLLGRRHEVAAFDWRKD
ncbi:putative d-galactose 1-dehydrogenase protein [Oceaniovalibus guishaninsula JLT2003]|uniref:Putative d-galactose 1-dehydrogenase protein n=1 Tax=Oceaniovalibus guishaninsula JLT2003 TaxID=1231392 RepID=K2HEB6_9RHOB|nr:Gfo/Idh/MocA family oxidoreductase [Oceaniovalibus guishaninsula]EKE45808.1 putative d-galactose 1-dehydrogenase protein [Oceaniovalibus guishaninsula JLT2003]